MLELVGEITEFHDLKQVLSVNKKFFSFIDHPRFYNLIEAGFSHLYRRALILHTRDSIETVLDPDRTDENKAKIQSSIFDLKTRLTKDPNFLSKKIKKIALVLNNYSIKDFN